MKMTTENSTDCYNFEEIAEQVCKVYNSKIKRNGKPSENEWTVLAAIVQEHPSSSVPTAPPAFKVVAIATGTKCLGKSQVTRNGTRVSDSHAEVLARRAFMCYLYSQLQASVDGCPEAILKVQAEKSQSLLGSKISFFILKDSIQFHMFISEVPCGDACVSAVPSIPNSSVDDNDTGDLNCSQSRTGAKIHGQASYEEVQEEGICRVKPGKGDPTLSMSCSDKIAKWQLLGLQGCLLSNFIVNPIKLRSIIIGCGVPYQQNSIERALYGRFSSLNSENTGFDTLTIYQSKRHNFMPNLRTSRASGAVAPASIIGYLKTQILSGLWNESFFQEVGIEGRKFGVTKKSLSTHLANLSVCRRNVFNLFVKFLKKLNPAGPTAELGDGFHSYYFTKSSTRTKYMERWKKMKYEMPNWTEKEECKIGFVRLLDEVIDLPKDFTEVTYGEAFEKFTKISKECSTEESQIDNRVVAKDTCHADTGHSVKDQEHDILKMSTSEGSEFLSTNYQLTPDSHEKSVPSRPRVIDAYTAVAVEKRASMEDISEATTVPTTPAKRARCASGGPSHK